MSQVSEDDREFVRSDLADLARRLKEKYSLSTEKIRHFLREMLTVSV